MATHLLVGNPTAQSGRNRERIEQALALLREAGIVAELLPTLPGGKTQEAVRAALDAGAHEAVIAMGGDGTFREVAAGLYTSARREQVPLGMLPTGTANDQGKSFGSVMGDMVLRKPSESSANADAMAAEFAAGGNIDPHNLAIATAKAGVEIQMSTRTISQAVSAVRTLFQMQI
jgi:diacylglycerol kinase family enzyme